MRLRNVAFLLPIALLISCAAMEPQIWPSGVPDVVPLWYQGPAAPMAPEAAMAALRNLQNDFCSWDGNNITQIEVDAYGLRAKAQWTETQTQSYYVPQTGGYWVGWNYVPYYGGSTQYTQTTIPREEMVIIPFNKVKAVEVLRYPNIPRDNKFGVAVALDGGATQAAAQFGWYLRPGQSVAVRCASEAAAREFADAVASLAIAQGRALPSPKGAVGLVFASLSAEQAQDLAARGISGGVLVVGVTEGGPAEKAEIKPGDVLLSLDGAAVTGDQQFLSLVQAAGSTFTLKGIRQGRVNDAKGNMVPGWVQQTFTVGKWGM